jgi:hypothetical protein
MVVLLCRSFLEKLVVADRLCSSLVVQYTYLKHHCAALQCFPVDAPALLEGILQVRYFSFLWNMNGSD